MWPFISMTGMKGLSEHGHGKQILNPTPRRSPAFLTNSLTAETSRMPFIKILGLLSKV